MTQYIIRRLLYLFPVLLGISIVTFVLVRAVPGNLCEVSLGYAATPELCAEYNHANGLDRPIFDVKPPFGQYGSWLGDMLRGDLGTSIQYRDSVQRELGLRLPVTFELMLLSLAVMLILAIPTGIIAGIRPNTPLDFATRTASVFGLSIPVFLLATLLLKLPTVWFNWFPPTYVPFFSNPLTNLQLFALPAIAMGIPSAAVIMRLTRSSVLEVLRQDYVRTAWSKGLRERTIIMRHVLKNGLIPIVTVIGLQIGGLLGGTVIIESIFRLPGIGTYTYQSILTRDYLGVQDIVVLLAAAYVLINLAVDITYGWLDPRIRFG